MIYRKARLVINEALTSARTPQRLRVRGYCSGSPLLSPVKLLKLGVTGPGPIGEGKSLTALEPQQALVPA